MKYFFNFLHIYILVFTTVPIIINSTDNKVTSFCDYSFFREGPLKNKKVSLLLVRFG